MRKTLVSITIIFSVGVLFFGSVILLKTGFAAGSSTNSVKIESNKLVEIETRPGINQKFILIKPANPIASVILFEGGPGKLNLKSFFGKPSVRSKKTATTFKFVLTHLNGMQITSLSFMFIWPVALIYLLTTDFEPVFQNPQWPIHFAALATLGVFGTAAAMTKNLTCIPKL